MTHVTDVHNDKILSNDNEDYESVSPAADVTIGDSSGAEGEIGGSSKLGSAFSSFTAEAPLRVSSPPLVSVESAPLRVRMSTGGLILGIEIVQLLPGCLLSCALLSAERASGLLLPAMSSYCNRVNCAAMKKATAYILKANVISVHGNLCHISNVTKKTFQ